MNNAEWKVSIHKSDAERVKFYLHPSKKVNATRLWSIIFLLSWVFIHQVRYPWKAWQCLFAFRFMPYLLGLFHWGACRVSKLGAMSKGKVAKLIGLYGKCMLCQVLSFPFGSCMHAYPLPIHCAEILRNCWRILAQWMGSGYTCIHSQKESPKLDIHVACISHTIRSILQLFLYDIAPNILTLHTPQWNNPNK